MNPLYNPHNSRTTHTQIFQKILRHIQLSITNKHSKHTKHTPNKMAHQHTEILYAQIIPEETEPNFLYAKRSDKPKPTDLSGHILPRVRHHALVCISELQEIKNENKLRKAAGKPLMDQSEKKKLLKALLKNPAFKQMYNDTYLAQYNIQREEYRQAQFRNPMSQNKAYIFDEDTLEYKEYHQQAYIFDQDTLLYKLCNTNEKQSHIPLAIPISLLT
jgi:hypothetical protein